jgi:ribosomal protein S18 acetylase RimI-like enzyme
MISMLSIRPFRPEDAPRIRDITVACFDGVSIDQNIERLLGVVADLPWQARKAAQVEDDCRAHPEGVFVAEVAGEVAGYVTTRINPHTRTGWIPHLAVDRRFRGRGIARALLAHAQRDLRKRGMIAAKIETLEQNTAGASLFPKLGFQEVARQIHYIKPLGPDVDEE